MKVLKIGAIWCPECLVMRPVWKKIEAQNPWLVTEYYEFDDNKDIAIKYNLEKAVIPTFIFLDKDNNEITRFVGEVEEKDLLKAVLENKDK